MKRAVIWFCILFALALPAVSCVRPLEPWEKPEIPEPEPEPEPDPTPTPTPQPPGPTPTPTPKPVASLHSAAYVFSDPACPLKQLELSSNGRYVAQVRVATKASEAVEVRTGTYCICDKTIVLLGLGAVTMESLNGKATCSVNCTDGRTYSGEASIRQPSSASSGASSLFKGWSITKTRISVSEGIKINADLNGCDLGELAKLLSGLGVKVDERLSGVKITDVVFTWESMLLRCSDGHNYSATCRFDGYAESGTFSFSLDDFLAGFSGGDGQGTVQFSGDICKLTLSLSFARGSKNYKGSIAFVLKPEAAASLTALTLSPATVSLRTGGTAQLVVSAVPADAVCGTLTWRSSDTSVAHVSAAGVVTALAPGKATVTVSDDKGHSASCTVTVG